MTEPYRLAVLAMPTINGRLWHQAFAAKADEAGWTVLGADASEAGPGSAVILVDDFVAAEALQPTSWLIVVDTPSAVIAASTEILGEATITKHVLWRASRFLAAASVKIAEGAESLTSEQISIAARGLGPVYRARGGSEQSPGADDRPLSLYDVLPPPPGANAAWIPDRFDYPVGAAYEGGTSSIDATGRARGIVHGPYVELSPGLWRAEIDVSVDPEGGKLPLFFEWGAGADFLRLPVKLTTAGVYCVSLERAWYSPEPAQVRLWISEPIFQGRIDFLGCRVTRLGDAPDRPPAAESAPEDAAA